MIQIDQLIRSRRKTIGLCIDGQGRLIVRAPLRISEKALLQALERKEEWIIKKQQQMRCRLEEYPPHAFAEGEIFYYLGEPHVLHYQEEISGVQRQEGRFCLAAQPREQARKTLEQWYRARAKELLSQRVEIYAKRGAIPYKSIRITGARTRWGSCGAKGSLNFSFLLLMARPEAIDYVVAHELAHILQRDHSPAFWKQVQVLMGDYVLWRRWLKEHASQLRWD